MGMFLEPEEIAKLTGKKSKGCQITQLRRMGLPFFVNATGHPVVARIAIEGGKEQPPVRPAWVPRVLKAG